MRATLAQLMLGLTLAVSALPTAAFSQNVRLSDASFDQIVDELKLRFRVHSDEDLLREMRMRLNQGGGGGGGGQRPSRYAVPAFGCNGKFLVVSLTNEHGQRQQFQHNIVEGQMCADQARILSMNVPNQIRQMSIAAYCSTSYLVQRPLLPSGEFGQPSQVRYRDTNECLMAQRQFYRGGRPNGPGGWDHGGGGFGGGHRDRNVVEDDEAELELE